MTSFEIKIEGIGPDLIDAYVRSGMDRGQAGEEAIRWAFGNTASAFAVARAGQAIVGMSAYIQTRMKFGESVGVGFQAVDSFVSQEMRGKGVFSALARAYDAHVKTTGGDLVWGFPNDNAAPAWFGKLGWQKHGQVPFLIKPIRAGYLLRKLRLPGDFPLSLGNDQRIAPVDHVGDWADALWERYARNIGSGTVRDARYLSYRLFEAPQAKRYRVVVAPNDEHSALVATTDARKHGGHIGYVLEALGEGAPLRELLSSELARLRDIGVEIALAWSYPWSPNYRPLRRLGFVPLPVVMRPIHIWFGARSHSALGATALMLKQWYLSYLDSDTI